MFTEVFKHFSYTTDCIVPLFVFTAEMKTGLRLIFAPRFFKLWAVGGGVPAVFAYYGYLHKVSDDKEAYAMRGRSNLFRGDHEKIKSSDPTRELWY